MGPLAGVKVLELAGIGPAPFCGMMLADLGADVVRIERGMAAPGAPAETDPLLRSRRSVALDLKSEAGVAAFLRLVEGASVLIEGFRPGVMEKLGLGPESCLRRNPRLVYGRVTGWGQEGPLAAAAGHDINFIALAGVLNLIGPAGGKPIPPLNLVGDFGGGGMLLLAGVLAALFDAERSGRGQVIDAAMVDGALALLAMSFGFRAQGRGEFRDSTGESLLAGAAPYYDSYQTSDGRYLAIGAIEPEFYARLLDALGLDRQRYGRLGYPALDAATRRAWPELREAIASVIATRTRDEWSERLRDFDACVAPVLTLAEATRHPQLVARGSLLESGGVLQNAPAPRFSRSQVEHIRAPRRAGEDTKQILAEAGLESMEIERLIAAVSAPSTAPKEPG